MLCKYGCGEEITWIDGKPFSLQSHFKVCGPNGRHKKAKPGPQHSAIDKATLEALEHNFGLKRALELARVVTGDTVEDRLTDAFKKVGP